MLDEYKWFWRSRKEFRRGGFRLREKKGVKKKKKKKKKKTVIFADSRLKPIWPSSWTIEKRLTVFLSLTGLGPQK